MKVESLEKMPVDSGYCCGVLQCVAMWPYCVCTIYCRGLLEVECLDKMQLDSDCCCSVLQCVAVCCSVLQCVAVCCIVTRCVAVFCSVLPCVVAWHHTATHCNTLQHTATHYNTLQHSTVSILPVETRMHRKGASVLRLLLQRVAACWSRLSQKEPTDSGCCCSVLHCVTVCYSVVQCGAV